MPPTRASTRPMPRGTAAHQGARRSARSAPRSTCVNPECTMTAPQNFAWDFDGLFGGAPVDVTQPLYTFGKIAHARAAARAGIDAQEALADEAAGDAAADAARAYWGLKLARELGYMLDDGIEQIDEGARRLRGAQGRHDPGSPARRRAARRGEGPARRAAQAEAQALAGLRAITRHARCRHRRRRARRGRARAARRQAVATATTSVRRRDRREVRAHRRRRARGVSGVRTTTRTSHSSAARSSRAHRASTIHRACSPTIRTTAAGAGLVARAAVADRAVDRQSSQTTARAPRRTR